MAAQQVALIPATDNEFTACKSDNRAVSAACAGLAVIADRIPSYAHFGDARRRYAARASALDSSDGVRILPKWLAACGSRGAVASS